LLLEIRLVRGARYQWRLVASVATTAERGSGKLGRGAVYPMATHEDGWSSAGTCGVLVE
jgi:hypothetical protein